jgi:hypothetical protein
MADGGRVKVVLWSIYRTSAVDRITHAGCGLLSNSVRCRSQITAIVAVTVPLA